MREGVALHREASKMLLPGGFGPESPPQHLQNVLEATGLTLAHESMRVVGVPIGTMDHQMCSIGDFMRSKSAAVVRALVHLKGAQARFRILRLSSASG